MTTSRRNGRRRGDPEEEEPKIPHSWTTGWTRFGRSKEGRRTGLSEADRTEEDQDAYRKR